MHRVRDYDRAIRRIRDRVRELKEITRTQYPKRSSDTLRMKARTLAFEEVGLYLCELKGKEERAAARPKAKRAKR